MSASMELERWWARELERAKPPRVMPNGKRASQSNKRRALLEAVMRLPNHSRIVARWNSSDGCRCVSLFYGVKAKRGQKL